MDTLRLSVDPNDEEILRAVELWVDDLVRDDYDAAYRRTEHNPYHAWTPELMRSVVHGYGLPDPDGPVFLVTPRQSATGTPSVSIDRADLGVRAHALAYVRYNLPLNGVWSDLTATFLVKARGEGAVLMLDEIHVF